MSSLVEELQRDALDSSVDVSDLLRKAYVVATKLKLAKFRAWCDFELNGYSSGELPEYRKMQGKLRLWNPYNGWIPLLSNDAELLNNMSLHHETNAIGTTVDLLRTDGGTFIVHLSSQRQNFLRRYADCEYEGAIHLGRGCLIAMVDAVRNTVLEWSLQLEAEGILGNGMSFSRDEKQIAEGHATELQSVVNHITIESMVNSTIQQASPSSGANIKSA